MAVIMVKTERNAHRKDKGSPLFNPVPDNKILDWSKLKQIADDISKCLKMKNKCYLG